MTTVGKCSARNFFEHFRDAIALTKCGPAIRFAEGERSDETSLNDRQKTEVGYP